MMHDWSTSMSGWDWAWMVAGLLALCALVVLGTVLALRRPRLGGGDGPPALPPPAPPSAEQILAERFARGEIGQEEYWERLHALRATQQQ